MTEQEWLACTDPEQMLQFLQDKTSERKLRLLACACCRRIWHLLTDERSRKALVTCELYADGLTTKSTLVVARREAGEAMMALITADLSPLERSRALAAAQAARHVARPTGNRSALADDMRKAVHAASKADTIGRLSRRIPSECILPQCDLLRDIFGPFPFRPVTLAPAVLTWNDATVVRLAQAAYEERHMPEGTLDNGRLAILADALEEAGRSDADILGHLRGSGPHVRGCWVVDLCLGKS
jgi:hypothetical protein